MPFGAVQRKKIKENMTTTSVSDLLKKKRQSTADKRLGSKNAYKFKGGVTTIRILPGWRNDDPTFSHSFGEAFIKNMDKEVLAVIGDRKLTYGEDDPIRSLIQRAMGDAVTDAQREHYKDMLASSRELVNALVLDDREIDPNVAQIVNFSESQFDSILEQVELAGIAEEFLDLEKGFNLKVSKTGTGFGTKYSFTFDRKPSAVNPAVLETLVDLDAFVRSKFTDTDRAINALKSLSQGAVLTPKSLSYSGDAETVDAEFSVIDEARNGTDETPTPEVRGVSDAEIDKLFGA
jgi:hypothetical protein